MSRKTICMRKLYLLIFIIHPFIINAQSNWEDGKLTWEDFQGEPMEASPYISELSYQLSYLADKRTVGDTTVYGFQTKNTIDPQLSWVKESFETKQLLSFNQVLFDIIEIHRRELQSELNKIQNIYTADEKLRVHYRNLRYEINQFKKESEHGMNAEVIDNWQQKVAEKLVKRPLVLLPPIEARPFAFGMNAGFGSTVFTGSVSDYFKPAFNFIFGFDLIYKNTILILNATLGTNRVNNEYSDNSYLWPRGLRTRVAIADLSLGQAILNNSKHKVTPFLGLGFVEFSVNPAEGEQYQDERLVHTGLIAGINYDFKLSTIINLLPNPLAFNMQERAEHNIRIKLYATTGSFDNMQGSTVSFSIGYNLLAGGIKVK